MAHGREMIMGGLRKAGTALNNFDTAYAKKVEESIGPNKVFRGITSAVPIYDVFDPNNPGRADTRMEKIGLAAMNTGVFASNVASRYALPAGGLTLAGKALYDMTVQFGGAADQPEQHQLPM